MILAPGWFEVRIKSAAVSRADIRRVIDAHKPVQTNYTLQVVDKP